MLIFEYSYKNYCYTRHRSFGDRLYVAQKTHWMK